MPSKTETTWTCSRCGVSVVIGPGTDLAGWRRAVIRYLSGQADENAPDWDLCHDCRMLLQKFLNGHGLMPLEGLVYAESHPVFPAAREFYEAAHVPITGLSRTAAEQVQERMDVARVRLLDVAAKYGGDLIVRS